MARKNDPPGRSLDHPGDQCGAVHLAMAGGAAAGAGGAPRIPAGRVGQSAHPGGSCRQAFWLRRRAHLRLLMELGPKLLQSVRTHLDGQPDQRGLEHLAFRERLRVCPVINGTSAEPLELHHQGYFRRRHRLLLACRITSLAGVRQLAGSGKDFGLFRARPSRPQATSPRRLVRNRRGVSNQ